MATWVSVILVLEGFGVGGASGVTQSTGGVGGPWRQVLK